MKVDVAAAFYSPLGVSLIMTRPAALGNGVPAAWMSDMSDVFQIGPN